MGLKDLKEIHRKRNDCELQPGYVLVVMVMELV